MVTVAFFFILNLQVMSKLRSLLAAQSPITLSGHVSIQRQSLAECLQSYIVLYQSGSVI